MQQRRKDMQCAYGILPQKAPLANPYVPFQQEDPETYDAPKGLVRGTIYPGLDLPFKGMVNKQEKSDSPKARLQTLGFVIQELALYLDTHRDDQEALELYRGYQRLYDEGRATYEKMCGPLNHTSLGEGSYRWLDDPWPWEYARNREV